MKSRRYSKFLTGLFTSILLISFVINPGMVAAGDTRHISISSNGMQINDRPGNSTISAVLSSSPVMFIENIGQFGSSTGLDQFTGARFLVLGGNSTIWLAEDAIWIQVLEPTGNSESEIPQKAISKTKFDETLFPDVDRVQYGVNLKISFKGANPKPILEPFQPLNTAVSYFKGNNNKNWASKVPIWGGVRYKDLYPGIDLEIKSVDGHLVQRFIFNTCINYENVRMQIDGADKLAISDNNLIVTTDFGKSLIPLAQQDGEMCVTTTPILKDNFIISPFIESNSPSISKTTMSNVTNEGSLIYSTFLGGSNYDISHDIAVDNNGAAYVIGTTDSVDFPTTPGAFQKDFPGYVDAFIAKLNPAGTALEYATYLGGSGYEDGFGIAIDDYGAAYVTGVTDSSDFPTTPGAFDTSYIGDRDAFVAKLDPTGTVLEYSTYLSGSANHFGGDAGLSIAVDKSGEAFVTGWTTSNDFPTTPNAFDSTYNGGYNYFDAFITKFNSAGNGLIYSSFLGGSSDDNGQDIFVDGSGAAYIAGTTWSSDFPVTSNAFQKTKKGWTDAFITKIDNTGSSLIYSTLLGGNGYDCVTKVGNMEGEQDCAIVVNDTGEAFLTGGTDSADFPTTVGAYQTNIDGDFDAFIVKLNADGSSLEYSTYLGGASLDVGLGIALNSSNEVYVMGMTYSSDFPTTQDGFSNTCRGCGQPNYKNDVFVSKLNASGSQLLYSTFLGGSDSECYEYETCGIDVDVSGTAFITGVTLSSDFPTTSFAFDKNNNHDSFVARLAFENTLSISGRVTDGGGNGISGVNISGGLEQTTMTNSSGNYTLSGLAAGTYTITPSKNGYTFSPTSHTVSVPPDASGQDFMGNLVNGAKPWLIMYYLNGDNSLNDVQSWVLQELENRQSKSTFNIAVMFDGRPNNDSRFYYIGDNISFTVKNELNSGDPSTLTEFINWARDMFPTQYNALIISDHGNLTGISEDDSQNRIIQLNELGTALQRANLHSGKIDVLFTEACLMGNIEAAYQDKDNIDYYVSSEQEIWMGTPPDFLEKITSTTKPEDLAIILAENYDQTRSNTPNTISVAQMSIIPNLANEVSQLANLIKSQINSLAGTLLKVKVLSAVQRFDSDGSGLIDIQDESIDLYSFSRLIFDNSNDVNLKSAAQAIMNSIQDDPNPANRYIIFNHVKSGVIPAGYEFAGNLWSLDDSHGVSIFFSRNDSKRSFYSGGLVSFAMGTDWHLGPLSSTSLSQDIIQWGPMLVSYEETINPSVTDDPNPPLLQAPLNAPYRYIFLPFITR